MVENQHKKRIREAGTGQKRKIYQTLANSIITANASIL